MLDMGQHNQTSDMIMHCKYFFIYTRKISFISFILFGLV